MLTKPITLNTKNRAKIETQINDAQDGARTRTITTDEVYAAAEQAEARLAAAGIPKGLRQGVTVRMHPHAVGRSYGHTAYGTGYTLVRRSTEWALLSVTREYTNDRAIEHTTVPAANAPAVQAAILRNTGLRFETPATGVAA